MTIEQLIREAAAAGRLNGLTLFRTIDGQYQAAISNDRVSWSVVIRDDPADAILAVLGGKTEEGIFG